MLPFNQVKISIYRNVRDTVGAQTTLDAFLRSAKHRETIERIRQVEDKKERQRLKTFLPCGTVSGLFGSPRKVENLIQHSGYLCIDIDADDNPYLGDLTTVRHLLETRPEVAYAGKSVSGRGLFAIVPLAHPEHHLAQFLAIEREYANLGITLDNSCKDVSRLRFVSYDEHPYINPHPVPYEAEYVEKSVYIPAPQNSHLAYSADWDTQKVSKCCNIIQRYHIDITGGYKDWFSIACSLSALGENGRAFFHIVSQQYPKYRSNECDAKFTEALNTRNRYPQQCQLGTFFWICKDYGVTYKQ